MFLHINPSNGIAIYDQIVRQVKFAVARGAIRPGNRVPSVREMARELTLNPNTVARAYQKLQSDGVLEPVRGMGLEVTSDALTHCRAERQKLIRERIHDALIEAQQSGIEGDALRQLIDQQLASVTEDGR